MNQFLVAVLFVVLVPIFFECVAKAYSPLRNAEFDQSNDEIGASQRGSPDGNWVHQKFRNYGFDKG